METVYHLQQKIIDQFREDYKSIFGTKLTSAAVLEFLEDNDIGVIDGASILKAIEKHQKAIDDIVIPRVIKTETVEIYRRDRDGNIKRDTRGHFAEPKLEEVKTYEGNSSEKKVQKLINNRKPHTDSIKKLQLLLDITKLYAPVESTSQQNQDQRKKSKNKFIKKGNTRSKENLFISSFIENSFDKCYTIPGEQKKIAEDNNVSVSWITNHFRNPKKLEFLKELFNELDKVYRKNPGNENIAVNYTLVNTCIDNLQKKESLRDYLDLMTSEKNLNNDIKKSSKFVSFDEVGDKELNKDTDRFTQIDSD